MTDPNLSQTDITIKTVTYAEAAVAIQAIRRQVFQQEQGVSAELEFDGLDDDAAHLLAYDQGQAVGTTRIRDLGYQTAKIERVAVLASYRRRGIGRLLMWRAIGDLTQRGFTAIKVNAQLPVQPFYERLGFEVEGEVFEEAGIPHVTMWRR